MARKNKVVIEGLDKLLVLIEKFKDTHGTIIGLLQDLHEEFGYLPEDHLRVVSSELDVPLSQLFSLATFYTGFRLEPMGKHHVCACVGTACHVRGAGLVVDTIERELGVEAGTTSEDGEFTFDTVNCLGACALGPLVTADGEYHGKMSQKKIKQLIKEFKEGSGE